jgi:hypothetical protein
MIYLNKDDLFVINKTLKMFKSTFRRQSKKLSVDEEKLILVTKEIDLSIDNMSKLFISDVVPKSKKLVIYVSEKTYKYINRYITKHARITVSGITKKDRFKTFKFEKSYRLAVFRITKNKLKIEKCKSLKIAYLKKVKKECLISKELPF